MLIFPDQRSAGYLENVKGARKKAMEGKLAFGTVDSWLDLEIDTWQRACN